jgi:hypothetical protein
MQANHLRDTNVKKPDAKAERHDSVFGRECRLTSRSLLRYEGQDVSLARCQITSTHWRLGTARIRKAHTGPYNVSILYYTGCVGNTSIQL